MSSSQSVKLSEKANQSLKSHEFYDKKQDITLQTFLGYLLNLGNWESEIIENMNAIPERHRHGFGVPPPDSVWSN